MAISKIKRRNKPILNKVEIKPKISTRDLIHSIISNSEDGVTFREIYEKIPHLSQRAIREHIQQLKNMNLLKMETCRCHSATIYYVR